MKRMFALLLSLLLALSFVACEGKGEPIPTDQAKPSQEGFLGDWYNTAGRKLEIKEDGTYRLDHEKDGGTWKKESDTLLECTDAYGSFTATRTTEDAGDTVCFGPYGNFRRATEEDLARFAQAQSTPLKLIGVFDEGVALATDGEKTFVINEDGLATLILNKAPFPTPEFFGDLLICNQSILDKNTGTPIANGEIVAKTEEHLVLVKEDKTQKATLYAVIDSHGTFVTDWTPISAEGSESGGKVYKESQNVGCAGGLLLYDSVRGEADSSRADITIYYLLNPLTNQKFRIEVPWESSSVYRFFESGLAFYSSAPGKISFAADWTSPATPVEYEDFRIKEDGSLAEIPNFAENDVIIGDWLIDIGDKTNQGKTSFSNAFTGQTFSLDVPTKEIRFKITEHYCAVNYTNEERTERKLALFDLQGTPLCDPIPTSLDTEYDATYLLSLPTFGDGTFFVKKENGSGKYSVYNAKGELIPSPETFDFSGYGGGGRFVADGTCVDQYGRVLIPQITFLPFQ